MISILYLLWIVPLSGSIGCIIMAIMTWAKE